MILSSVEFPMMPSTKTRQDTTVLMYLKVSLISMVPSHGGKDCGRRDLPPGGTLGGGVDDPGRLALEPHDQAVLLGGVINSAAPRGGKVEATAGWNPLSVPWTTAIPHAQISATKAARGGGMPPPAPVGSGWPLQRKKGDTIKSSRLPRHAPANR